MNGVYNTFIMILHVVSIRQSESVEIARGSRAESVEESAAATGAVTDLPNSEQPP